MARSSTAKRQAPATGQRAPGAVDLGWLGGTVGFHLRTAQEAAFRAFARRAGSASARPWRFAILALIDSNPGLTQVALARALRRDTSSLTSALDDLCRSGFVVRQRVEDNRRSYALTLTPDGRRAMRELMESAAEHEREMDRLVGRENRAEFIRTLQRIAAGLESDD
jgi:DNA-binding MarR family transcriptional regulator